jgi:hypothetical protein
MSGFLEIPFSNPPPMTISGAVDHARELSLLIAPYPASAIVAGYRTHFFNWSMRELVDSTCFQSA